MQPYVELAEPVHKLLVSRGDTIRRRHDIDNLPFIAREEHAALRRLVGGLYDMNKTMLALASAATAAPTAVVPHDDSTAIGRKGNDGEVVADLQSSVNLTLAHVLHTLATALIPHDRGANEKRAAIKKSSCNL